MKALMSLMLATGLLFGTPALASTKPTYDPITNESIRILRDIIQIPSENNHEVQVAEYLRDVLKSHGIQATLVPYAPGRSNLIAEIRNGKGKTLAISGHMDVVDAGNPAEWTHPPFSAHIDDEGMMWGRGATDMKSGLSALVMAMIRLNETKNFTGTIRLIATVGEEIGELGANQLTTLGYMDDVDGLLIAEPSNVGIIHAHKGSLNYKVIAKGVAAHSSMPTVGKNAIDALTLAMTTINGELQQKFNTADNAILGKGFSNVTLIKGGNQINSIPDHAEYQANARTVPEFDNQAVIAEIQRIIDQLNSEQKLNLSLEVTADLPPVEAKASSPLIDAIIDTVKDQPSLGVSAQFDLMQSVLKQDLSAAKQRFGKTQISPMAVSGTTDAAQFLRHRDDIDLAIYGPGIPMLNHKVDERVPLEQYLAFIDVYEQVISRYLTPSTASK